MKTLHGIPLIKKLVKTVFPAVDSELERWHGMAGTIPDCELRSHALASIEKKKFHCLGGCAYALFPGAHMEDTVRFIVAFQTISDYLDNLCDRSGVLDEAAFRQLHLSMQDCVSPENKAGDYYALYPRCNDGGYLNSLVEACREQMGKLASTEAVQARMAWLISHYSELQAMKHMELALREERLARWAGPLAAEFPIVSVWEFCAAAGSTLGVFLLFAAAQTPGFTQDETNELLKAYFPWVCGLHIQLDYYIDAQEDRAEGDFNFTFYYKDSGECAERLSFFVERSMAMCLKLKYPGFHRTVIRGLLAVYLSDPKSSGANRAVSHRVLKNGGGRAALYCGVCRIMRGLGKL